MLGLRTCIYKVADLDAAKKWYADAFGTVAYFDEPFYVGFNIGGFELGLMPEEPGQNSKGENVMTYWGVDDIEESFQSLIKKGATAHEKPVNVGGELMVASVFDPWKNVVGLIYNPAFSLG